MTEATYAEQLAAHTAHLELSMRHPGLFDPRKVMTAEPPEPFTLTAEAPSEATLSHDDVSALARKLADRAGIDRYKFADMVTLTHRENGIGFSAEERIGVLAGYADAIEAGRTELTGDQVMMLSSTFGDGMTAASRYGSDTLALSVSAAERHRMTRTGQALPGGDFPIGDASHLAAAKAEYRAGNLAGHTRKEVKDHINRNAERLELPGLDEDDHDEHVSASALADYGDPELAKAELESLRLTAAHSEFGFQAGQLDVVELARRKGLTHTYIEPDSRDTDQPADPRETHRKVAALLKEHSEYFGGEDLDAGKHSSQVIRPKSPAQREREETRARAGHQAGNRSIPDMAAHRGGSR